VGHGNIFVPSAKSRSSASRVIMGTGLPKRTLTIARAIIHSDFEPDVDE
jgi:hypothetical protein